MTAAELAIVRDLRGRLEMAQRRVGYLEREITFLRSRGYPDPTAIHRLKLRLAKQRDRAELWKHRAMNGRKA